MPQSSRTLRGSLGPWCRPIAWVLLQGGGRPSPSRTPLLTVRHLLFDPHRKAGRSLRQTGSLSIYFLAPSKWKSGSSLVSAAMTWWERCQGHSWSLSAQLSHVPQTYVILPAEGVRWSPGNPQTPGTALDPSALQSPPCTPLQAPGLPQAHPQTFRCCLEASSSLRVEW